MWANQLRGHSHVIRRRFLLVGDLLISTEGAQIARQIQFMLCFRGKYAVFDDEFDPAPLNVQKFVKVEHWLFVFEFWVPAVKYAFGSGLGHEINDLIELVFRLWLLYNAR